MRRAGGFGGRGGPTGAIDIAVMGERLDEQGRPAGLHGSVTVAADLFEPATAAARALVRPGARPGDSRAGVAGAGVRWWTPASGSCLRGWNDTAAAVPAATVLELFARGGGGSGRGGGARRRGQTDLRGAGRRSADLPGGWCWPWGRVGVGLVRGVDLVTAMLAVWKAGGAYLPIDALADRAAGVHGGGQRHAAGVERRTSRVRPREHRAGDARARARRIWRM